MIKKDLTIYSFEGNYKKIKGKILFVFLIFMVLFIYQTLLCFGNEDSVQYNADTVKINCEENIISIIPDSLRQYFNTDEGLSQETVKNLDGEFFLSFIIQNLGEGVSAGLSLFLFILSIISITSLFNSFASHLSPKMQSVINFASSACCAVSVFSVISDDLTGVVNAVDSTNTFLSTFAPIVSLIYASAGEINGAVVASSGTLFNISVTNIMTHSVLMPVLRVCFSLEVISAISGKSNLSSIASTLKNIFIFICGIIMTVITTVFAYQTIVAQGTDTTLLRTARFAMGSLPIVGGALSEAARTLAGSFGLIKSLTGTIGVCVILITVLPPLIYIFISKIIMSLSRILAAALECDNLAGILKGGEDILSFSGAILIIFDIAAVFSVSVLLMMGV